MSAGTLALARASALHALDRAEALAARAEAAGLARARLAPGMWDAAEQLGCAAGFAERAVLPLVGLSPEEREAPADAAALRARIAAARRAVETAEGAPPERIAHGAGFAELDQSPEDYAARFALPNLWFHLSMACAILRANGVEVGKADYDGLHAYPEGFSWED